MRTNLDKLEDIINRKRDVEYGLIGSISYKYAHYLKVLFYNWKYKWQIFFSFPRFKHRIITFEQELSQARLLFHCQTIFVVVVCEISMRGQSAGFKDAFKGFVCLLTMSLYNETWAHVLQNRLAHQLLLEPHCLLCDCQGPRFICSHSKTNQGH